MPLSSWHLQLTGACRFCNQGIITARSRAFLRTMHPRSPTSLPSWATRTGVTRFPLHGLPLSCSMEHVCSVSIFPKSSCIFSTFSRQEWPTLSERWTDQAPSWTRKRALKHQICAMFFVSTVWSKVVFALIFLLCIDSTSCLGQKIKNCKAFRQVQKRSAEADWIARKHQRPHWLSIL